MEKDNIYGRYATDDMMNTDYAGDLTLHSGTPVQADYQLNSLEQAGNALASSWNQEGSPRSTMIWRSSTW